MRSLLAAGLAAVLVALPAQANEATDLAVDAEALARMGPTLPPGNMGEELSGCFTAYAEVERLRREAGVRHQAYFPVRGFPYVKVDRLMASYVDDLDPDTNMGAWLEQTREFANFSRELELRDIGISDVRRAGLLHDLSLCSVWLTLLSMDELSTRAKLLDAVRSSVPPAAPAPARAPAKPASELSRLVRWDVRWPETAETAEQAQSHFDACDRDAMGRVGLFETEWQALAAKHAPVLMTETLRSIDGLVSPQWDAGAMRANARQATVHYQPQHVRLGDMTLLQFAYTVWMRSTDDAPFNGLVWRVTLAPDGKPLVYDTVRLDGSGHRWFLADTVSRGNTPINVPVLPGPVALLIDSARHDLVNVVKADQAPAPTDTGRFDLAIYDDLFEAEGADGNRHTLFADDGSLRPGGTDIFMLGRMPAVGDSGLSFDHPRLIEESMNLPVEDIRARMPDACELI